MKSSIALIDVSNALSPSSLFIVVVVTTYVGGAIKFICGNIHIVLVGRVAPCGLTFTTTTCHLLVRI